MLRRINGITTFLMSVSVSALLFHQASAGQILQDSPTCDANDPKSTIESCDAIIKHYKEFLAVTELDIRSKQISDPYRAKEMREYARFQTMLTNAILNKSKIQKNSGAPTSNSKSSFRWNNSAGRASSPLDTTTAYHSNPIWSGTGAAVQTTFGISNIYRVTGTFVVPSATIPSQSMCTGDYTNFDTVVWVGIGGDPSPAYMTYANLNSTLYQAGVNIRYNCATNSAIYEPWYEDLPLNPTEVIMTYPATHVMLPLSAGDTVQIIVTYPYGYVGTSSQSVVFEEIVSGVDNWTHAYREFDTSHTPPGRTAEAIIERTCYSTARNSSNTPYCPSSDWLSPLAYPQSEPPGSVVFADLKYSFTTNRGGGPTTIPTQEASLNIPYNSPDCDNLIQNPLVPNQCTVNVVYSMPLDTCDTESATVATDTSTNFIYVAGNDLPNGNNGLCSTIN